MRSKLRQDVEEVKSLLGSINSALIVREPGTALAADAYDGLRRQVAAATAERHAHLAQLVRILEALDNGVSAESLQQLVEQWAEQAGLRRWDKPDPVELFEIMGTGDGPLEVVQPAWVDGDQSNLVKQGLLKRHKSPPETSTSPSHGADAASREDET
jgi:hypothetical protein